MQRLKTVGGSSVLASHLSFSQLERLESLLPSSEPVGVVAVVDEFVVAVVGGSKTVVGVGVVAWMVVLMIAGPQSKEEGSVGRMTGAGVCSRPCQRRSVGVAVVVGRCNFLEQKKPLKRCSGWDVRSELTGRLKLKSRKEVHWAGEMGRIERHEYDRSSDLDFAGDNVKDGSGWGQRSGGRPWRLDPRVESEQGLWEPCFQND